MTTGSLVGDSQKVIQAGSDGSVVEVTNGAPHVRTIGAAGTLEVITFTCNAATDCITDLTAPVTTEICLADSFTAGKKRVRFTFHNQQYNAGNAAGTPHAAGAFVTVNNGTEAEAIARFTTADNGPSATPYTTFLVRRMISPNMPIAEFNLEGTDATVDDVAVGFILPTGTGSDAVRVDVEVW